MKSIRMSIWGMAAWAVLAGCATQREGTCSDPFGVESCKF